MLQIKLTTNAEGGFNSALSLAVSGLPPGVTAVFSPSKIAAPGSGSATLILTATGNATLGAVRIQVTVTGAGFSGTAVVPLTLLATNVNDHVQPAVLRLPR
jgi:hypothetical protein